MKITGRNNTRKSLLVKRWLIMHRLQNASAASDASSSRSRNFDDFNNSNIVVPSVLSCADIQNDNSFSSSSDTEVSLTSQERDGSSSTNPRQRRRRIRDEDLPLEERQRRSIRRERNKLAAAKCRKRRVDQTCDLQDETNNLEVERQGIEESIRELMEEKEQLQFILTNHKNVCKLRQNSAAVPVVKREIHCPSPPVLQRHSPHQPRPQTHLSAPPPTLVSARPSTLPLGPLTLTMTPSSSEATGIPITTPSRDGLFHFGGVDAGLLTPTCTAAIIHKKTSSLDTPAGITPSSPTFLTL